MKTAWRLLATIVAVAVPVGTAEAEVHVWEKHELTFYAQGDYENSYTDVELWVDLKGPEFDKRVYGFWDGGATFRVRLVATAPGNWTWTSGSNPPDAGLAGQSGEFAAVEWDEREKQDNPNRRGFLRPTDRGVAFNYADGTPYFCLADTWWGASTWRYPFRGAEPKPDYTPGPGIGFEDAIQFRKKQGYNGVALIAAYPSWHPDDHPARFSDEQGVPLRAAWRIRESWNDGAKAARMTDETGHRSFLLPGKVPGYENVVPDFDRINPAYFQSLDKKMQYMSDEGFVPFFETVRRDHGPAWKTYYDWPGSFVRYVQYLVARYGCYNMIFSAVHTDTFGDGTPQDMPNAAEWNEALTAHYEKYGPLPFGQPVTTNIHISTYRRYGHGDEAPWLTMHGVGNRPRDHGQFLLLEEMFKLPNPYPALNNEGYYPHSVNPTAARVHGDQISNTRANAWGSVLNGGLAGYIYGTQGYYVSTGEPEQDKPHVWVGLDGEGFSAIGRQMAHLKEFMLSEGARYQDLVFDRYSLDPYRKSTEGPEEISDEGRFDWSLSGWASMMRTPDRSLIFAYFEVDCPRADIKSLEPGTQYRAQWFNPRDGRYSDVGVGVLTVGEDGVLELPNFPGDEEISTKDWALKLEKPSS